MVVYAKCLVQRQRASYVRKVLTLWSWQRRCLRVCIHKTQTQRFYDRELQLTPLRGRNKCSYMHPHWKPLQPLCSWSGYGPGSRLANLLQCVVYSKTSCKIPRLPPTFSNLGDSSSSSFASTLVLPHFYACVHTHTHTHTHTALAPQELTCSATIRSVTICCSFTLTHAHATCPLYKVVRCAPKCFVLSSDWQFMSHGNFRLWLA